MARIQYRCTVDEIIDHTPNVRELKVKLIEPAEFKFKAGQFVMIHVPQDPKPALRAYSIASEEQRTDGYTLLFKYVENGVASKYVWDLKGGEDLTFTGPFGRVFFQEPPTEQIVFLNTGTGLAQHYSYLKSKQAQFPNLRYRMLFGVRTEKDIYYEPELDALKKEFSNFEYEFVLSRPSESWTGKKGYVQDFISDFNYKNIPTTFYLCGNGGMIKDVKKRLIEDEGFDKALIHAEAFD